MNVKQIEKLMDVIKTLVTILISFAVTIILILLVSKQPMSTIHDFFLGPFMTVRRMGNIIEMVIPILFTGCAVCIMYSVGHINMATSACFYLGGLGASIIAYSMQLVPGIHPIVALLMGGVLGSLVAVIPPILRIRWEINEVVSSLMINYIIVYLGTYILRNFMLDPYAGFGASWTFETSSKLPVIIPKTRIHAGVIIAIAVVVFAYLFLGKTKWGYQMRMMGRNKSFAIYSGMGVAGILLTSQLIGGFLAGLGGASEVLGLYTRFEWAAAPTAGFDGIIVAALARRNPLMVPVAALFLAYIRVGADVISRTSDVPFEIVSIIQALIIMLIGAEMFMSHFKHKQIIKASERQLAKEGN